MDGQPLKEFLPGNNLPVNQLAKQALKKVGRRPDPTVLYWVQLVDWFLDLADQRPLNSEFPALWKWFQGVKPRDQQWWLEHNPEGPDPDLETSLYLTPKKEYSPEDLASELIDSLESNLSWLFPNYPQELS